MDEYLAVPYNVFRVSEDVSKTSWVRRGTSVGLGRCVAAVMQRASNSENVTQIKLCAACVGSSDYRNRRIIIVVGLYRVSAGRSIPFDFTTFMLVQIKHFRMEDS